VNCPFAHLTAFAGAEQGGESPASPASRSRWSTSAPIETMLRPMMVTTT